MRTMVIIGLILVVLAISFGIAASMQLSGNAGKAILVNLVNNTTSNQTINANQSINTTDSNQSLNTTANQANTASPANNASAGGLWSWGTAPAGHTVDKSGNLVMTSGNQEWTPGV